MLLSPLKLSEEHKMNEYLFFLFVFQTSVDLEETVDSIMSANTNCVISKYKSVL